MRVLRHMKLTLIMIGAVALLAAGCGGGGGGGSTTTTTAGDATALQVADRVSVVDAQDEGGGGGDALSLSIGLEALAVADLPANSPYNTDPSFTYVEERSAEGFEIINEILCFMGQTQYDEMLNKGNYKAQIDVGQCEKERDNASTAGQGAQNQSSGANATEYEFWTVNSSRVDDSSPHIVKIWFEEEGESGPGWSEPSMKFQIKTTITEGVSDSNPYGLFTMQFKSSAIDDSVTYMTGTLKSEVDSESGQVLLKFYNDGNFGAGNETFTEAVTLNRAGSGASGAGSISQDMSHPDWGSESTQYDIAYNDSYFYRSDGTNTVCMDRLNTDISAWRYGMYYDENSETPGERVEASSGFPIKIVEGEETYHGWAGYYGLWLPEEASVENGDTVFKQDYSESGTSEEEYNVFIARGKLIKHTRKSLTLAEIANIPLHWHECTEGGCSQYRVEWNSTTQKLYKNGEMNEENWVWQDIDPAEEVVFDPNAWDFSFWSESLGGSGRINLKDPEDEEGGLITFTNSTNVIFHVTETMYPGDSNIPANLACFESCLDPTVINTSAPYFAQSTWDSEGSFAEINNEVAPADLAAGTNYIAYTFDSETMELQHTGEATLPVVMTDSENSQNGGWTGALIDLTTENRNALACAWDETNQSTCSWQIWDNIDVFYTWETGTQQWNQLTALQDGETFISFDPPLSVEYTHTWDDLSTSKFYLEYSGFGDLHGIPGKCVDMDTGQDSDCWDETGEKYIRWVPEFTVPDGSAVTDAVTEATYYVKALEKEERMTSVDESQCTGDGLSITPYTLPDGSDYQDPNIGTAPVVDGAPAVIGGVVQE